MANAWYSYIGTGDPTVASNYSKIVGKPGCLNGATVCTIYAPSGGRTPVSPLPSNILTYIANGKAQLVAQPQLPGGSKLFVYMQG